MGLALLVSAPAARASRTALACVAGFFAVVSSAGAQDARGGAPPSPGSPRTASPVPPATPGSPRTASPGPAAASGAPAPDDLDALLAAEEAQLRTLVVTGRRAEQAEDEVVERVQVLRREELERGGVRDLGEALEEQPGVRVLRGVRGTSVEMLGLGPTYALVLVDGDRVPGRSNGAIDLGRFTMEDVERVEIVLGSGSALYGSEAIGGVINLIPRRPRRPVELDALLSGGLVETGASALDERGLVDASVRAGVRSGRLSARLSASAHLAPGFAREGQQDAPRGERATQGSARRQGALGGRLWWEPDARTEISAYADYTLRRLDGVDLAAGGAVLDRVQLGEQLLAGTSASFGRAGGPRLRLRASYGLSRDQLMNDQRRGVVLDEVQDAREHLGTLQAQYERPLGRHALVVGYEQLAQVLSSPRLVRDGLRSRFAGFAQDEWTAVDAGDVGLVVSMGARLDVDTQFGTRASPKLAVRLDLGDHVVLRASHGWGFRAPSFQELLLRFENTSAGYVVDGNPDLGPETSRGTMTSVEWRPSSALRLALGGFHNDVDGLITAAPRSTGPGGTLFSYVNVARATTLGADLTIAWRPWRPLELRGTYALLGTRDVARDRPLDGRPVHRGTVSVNLDEPRTRLSGAIRAAIGGKRAYFTDAPDGQTLRTTAPATVQLDARLGWGVTRAVEVHVGVDNVLDTRDAFLALMPRTVYAGLRLRHPEAAPRTEESP